MSACARVMATRTVCGTYGVDRRSPRGDWRAGGRVVRATPAGRLGGPLAVSRRMGRAGHVSRATLDAEGIPWNIPEKKRNNKGEPKAPPGLSLEQFPGETLPELCLLYTSPSPRDGLLSRMPSSA